MHEHNECEHELEYCERCDVVYCEKCKKEWKRNTWVYTQPMYQPMGDSIDPNITVTYSDNTSNHVHSSDS